MKECFIMIGFLWGLLIYGLRTVLSWIVVLLHGNVGLGIIAFTFGVRSLLAPLSYRQEKQAHFRQKSVTPRYGILEKKYNTRDSVTIQKLYEGRYHLQQLVKKQRAGHHHYTLLFLAIQFIIIWGLVDTIRTTNFIYKGSFLGLKLNNPDPHFILPIIACLLTAGSQVIIACVNHSWNHFTEICLGVFPVFILFEGFFSSVALVLYWITLYLENIVQECVVGVIWKVQDKKHSKSKKAPSAD